MLTWKLPYYSNIIMTTEKQSSKIGRIAQSVTCLATDAFLTTDPGIASLIPVRFHTFVDNDYEMIEFYDHFPPFHSRRVVVSYKRKNVHEVLVNGLFQLAHEKVWLCELTVPPGP